jgi:hypothetical protein
MILCTSLSSFHLSFILLWLFPAYNFFHQHLHRIGSIFHRNSFFFLPFLLILLLFYSPLTSTAIFLLRFFNLLHQFSLLFSCHFPSRFSHNFPFVRIRFPCIPSHWSSFHLYNTFTFFLFPSSSSSVTFSSVVDVNAVFLLLHVLFVLHQYLSPVVYYSTASLWCALLWALPRGLLWKGWSNSPVEIFREYNQRSSFSWSATDKYVNHYRHASNKFIYDFCCIIFLFAACANIYVCTVLHLSSLDQSLVSRCLTCHYMQHAVTSLHL